MQKWHSSKQGMQWHRQAFQTGGAQFIRWKIVGGHAKKQATKKQSSNHRDVLGKTS